MTDDVTKMRAKLLYELKQDDEMAYSLDCKLFCVKKMPNKEEKCFKIVSPDDLFIIGWAEEKLKGLGFYL